MSRNRETINDLFDMMTIKERYEIIRRLDRDYDPGTFADLEHASLAELRELEQIMSGEHNEPN